MKARKLLEHQGAGVSDEAPPESAKSDRMHQGKVMAVLNSVREPVMRSGETGAPRRVGQCPASGSTKKRSSLASQLSYVSHQFRGRRPTRG